MNMLLRTILVIFSGLMLAVPVEGQLDPGNFDIFQQGRKVGEIFGPPRAAGQTRYAEHWVLFRDYVYPGGGSSPKTEIDAARRSYASEEDFFARVPWGPGFRYVRVEAADADRLPGRR